MKEGEKRPVTKPQFEYLMATYDLAHDKGSLLENTAVKTLDVRNYKGLSPSRATELVAALIAKKYLKKGPKSTRFTTKDVVMTSEPCYANLNFDPNEAYADDID